MRDNHQYFLDAVLPVAAEAGVRLALHPDDPPVEAALGGVARIFTSPAALAGVYRAAGGSPAWGIDLCLGTAARQMFVRGRCPRPSRWLSGSLHPGGAAASCGQTGTAAR
jgi:hypothetical protein